MPLTTSAAKAARTERGVGATKPQEIQDAVRAQFSKTEMCSFYPNCRKGDNCPFAHSDDEMKRRPKLNKTSLCRDWQNKSCCLDASECSFAHGYSDMRRTSTIGKSKESSSKSSATKCTIPSNKVYGHSVAILVSTIAASPQVKLMEQELKMLQHKYASAQRLQIHLLQQMQYMREKVDTLAAESVDTNAFPRAGLRTFSSDNTAGLREIGLSAGPSCENTRASSFLGPQTDHMRELTVEKSQERSSLIPIALASDRSMMWRPCQGKMLEMLLLSALPDYYED